MKAEKAPSKARKQPAMQRLGEDEEAPFAAREPSMRQRRPLYDKATMHILVIRP